MNVSGWMIVVLVAAVVSGCEATTNIRETAQEIHDREAEAGEALYCAAGPDAHFRLYGTDPDKMRKSVDFCGWSEYFRRMDGGGLK